MSHDTHACLNTVSHDMMSAADTWRQHGDAAHNGAGQAFAYHALNSTFAYLIAYDFIRMRPAEADALNAVSMKPGGFANLPVPRDHVLMLALMPAMAFIHQQDGIAAGKTTGSLLMNGILRDAARMVRRLMPHVPLSEAVQAFYDMTDDQLAHVQALGDLDMMTPAGRG